MINKNIGSVSMKQQFELACKIYLDLGFRPIPQNAVHSRDGWRIVKALTNHAALDMFDAAKADEIIRD